MVCSLRRMAAAVVAFAAAGTMALPASALPVQHQAASAEAKASRLVQTAAHEERGPRAHKRKRKTGVSVRAPYTDVDVDRRVRVDAPYTGVRVYPGRSGNVRVRAPYVDLFVNW